MDKERFKETIARFNPLGQITSRAMFGGYGLFADGIMFGLIVNDTLHIRAVSEQKKVFEQQGLKPHTYFKKGFPVVTQYFAISEELWRDQSSVLRFAKQAWEQAKANKINQENTEITRLKDLPNLRLTSERMLKKAGIETVQELEAMGSAQAFQAIKTTHSNDIRIDLLWALEGAIRGIHWSRVSHTRQEELLNAIRETNC